MSRVKHVPSPARRTNYAAVHLAASHHHAQLLHSCARVALGNWLRSVRHFRCLVAQQSRRVECWSLGRYVCPTIMLYSILTCLLGAAYGLAYFLYLRQRGALRYRY